MFDQHRVIGAFVQWELFGRPTIFSGGDLAKGG